jgi:type I restriction enzyme, S subunit
MTMNSVRLGDVLKIERIPVDVDLEREYMQIGIRSYGKGVFHRDKVSGSELGKLNYFEIHPGRLIVSNIMAWEGAIAVSSADDAGCVGSQRFLSYIPSPEIDIRYLNLYFQSEAGRAAIKGTSTGTVLRNQTLSIKDFENLSVPIPGLGAQRRIADHLDSALAQVQRVEELRLHRTKLHAALIETWISEALAGESEQVNVGSVIRLERRQVIPDREKEYREIGLRSFGRGVFHKDPISGAELGAKRVFMIEPGDLLLSNVFAWEGAIALAGETERGFIGSHRFMTYRADTARADASYLRHFFVSRAGLKMVRHASPGSAGRNRTLGIKAFEAEMIPLPPLAVQRRASAMLDKLANELAANDSTAVIAALRPSLLNAAFSGDL